MNRVVTRALVVLLAAAPLAAPSAGAAVDPTTRINASGRVVFWMSWDRYSSPVVGPFRFSGFFASGARTYTSTKVTGTITPINTSGYPMQVSSPHGEILGDCNAYDRSPDPSLVALVLDCSLRVRGTTGHIFLDIDGVITNQTGDGLHDPVFAQVSGVFRRS